MDTVSAEIDEKVGRKAGLNNNRAPEESDELRGLKKDLKEHNRVISDYAFANDFLKDALTANGCSDTAFRIVRLTCHHATIASCSKRDPDQSSLISFKCHHS
jgi:hypothetical protein